MWIKISSDEIYMSENNKTRVRSYEIMLIIRAGLPDLQKNVVLKKSESILKNLGAEIVEEDIWGKRLLSYKIAKQTEGYYVVIHFRIQSEMINEAKMQISVNPDILRFVVLNLDSKRSVSLKIGKKKLLTSKSIKS